MKRLFSLSVFLMAAMLSFAYDFEVGGIYYEIDSYIDMTVDVAYQGTYIEHNEYKGDVIIPETVCYDSKTYRVTGIKSYTFRECTDLTSVTIPSGVTYIGSSAFQGCTNLKSIEINSDALLSRSYSPSSSLKEIFGNQVKRFVIGNDVKTIGLYAFYRYSSLTSIAIGNSVTSICASSFYGCTGLTSIEIPNSVTGIGSSVFYGCTGLTSIEIPNSVNTIGDYAFYQCSSLKSVTIGNSVTSMGRSVFDGCSITSVEVNSDALVSKGYSSSSSLKDIFGTQVQKFVIGDDVKTIGFYAFYGYSSIASISIGNSVTSIGSNAFSGCSGLTSITIPNSVTSIGSNAFQYCSGLTSATIPSSVTSIGSGAFYSCSGLKSVTIPNSVTSIGSSAFLGCSGLKKVRVTDIAAWCNISFGNYGANPLYYAMNIYSDEDTEITDLVIPDGVTIIHSYAFYNCNGLKSVTIPNSVTSIGSNAFERCSGLTKVIVPDIAAWCKISFIDNAANPLRYAKHIYSDENTEITDLVIPNSVTTIGNYAFYNCSGLTSITIPNSVTSIGNSAFDGCSGLTSLSIPNSVTSIGNSAFDGCSGLTSLSIPNSVTSIGSNAFSGCSGLTSVTINSNSIISNTESSLSNIFGSQVKSYIIGDGVTTIGNRAFDGCSGLTSVEIPNGVTSIGGSAFYGCSGLTSVEIPNSVTSIGGSAFYGCSGLSSVILPDNITSIYQSSFSSSTKFYLNIGTKTLLKLWREGYPNIYNKETKQKISRPTLSASATQATLKVFINEMLDGYTYTCDGKIMTDNVVFDAKGLRPGYSTSFSVKISLDDINYYSFNQSFSTYDLNPSVKGVSASASSINATGSYRAGDAKIVKHELSCNDKKVDGTNTSFCGLKPNTSYKVIYTVTVAYGKNDEFTDTYTKECTVKTSELKMTTEQPKVVSVGNVIVSAKANVDDAETNVGFEWRRTDWTDDFKSNTGTAYMYEGTMEGYIRNLNAEKLWKFRPYYLADDGTYYYGDWMGLDPTNTSYFEPTVHTYANINIEGNTALVKGYALGGTDKITVQGFKYWKAANLAPSGDLALEARKASPAIPADAETIEAEGRVMEATLSGLDYECTYSYVAFAKTEEGTFYGEVKTFTTGPNTTGIEVVRDANSEAKAVDDKVKGIYTLTGVKLSDDAADLKTLKRGIYIVNGRKVAVK